MNVLIIGSGGREQAIAWKVAKSKEVETIFIAPGNAGTQSKCVNLPTVEVNDFPAISNAILKHKITLLIIGPEVPLVEGLVDFLRSKKEHRTLHIVGPTKAGAMLEGSKDFAKAFMKRHGIPTAKYLTCTIETIEEGKAFIRHQLKPPYVLKADGLAAGKGVLIIDDEKTAIEALQELLSGSMGNAGKSVVLEEYLEGIECSLFVLTDGTSYCLLPEAKDYKRIGDGDKGPNTGGMGAVSPVRFADDHFISKVKEEIIKPTIAGLREEGIDYSGFIFFGLMNCNGQPYVIEYNCRLGDPETEAIMLRIDGDILPYLLSLREQRLSELPPLNFSDDVAVTVVATSAGYPGGYQSGFVIEGIGEDSPAEVFHAGTSWNATGEVVTKGGRVLAVTATGATQEEALKQAYERLRGFILRGSTTAKTLDKTFNIATYIEELSLGLDGLMAQTWLCVVLYLLSLVLMYRYSVIAFGSRHIGFHSVSTFGLLLLLPMIDGYSIANWSFLSLIVLEYVGELQLSALNKRRRPLYAFNVGLLLSLLTFIHRGFLFLLPLFLFQIRYLERRDYRHYVALVLGFLTLWWIYLLFMAPAPDELGGFLLSQWRPLCEVDLPFGHTLFSTVLLVLTALLSWGFSFIHSNSTIQRVRVIIQSRLRLSLLLTFLHLFYSGVGGMVFYSSAMLLLLSTHFHYYSVNSRLLYWGRIILLLIVCSLLVLRYVGLFN